MDFVSYMRDQSEKLNSRHYVAYLYSEIEEKQENELDSYSINDFNNHLPLMYHQFWEMALDKVQEKNTGLDDLDQELLKYILVLIYHSLSQDTISQNTLLCSSQVYIELITLRSEDFFHSKLYKNVLINLQSCLETQSSEELTNALIRKLSKFLAISKLSTSDLKISLATLIHIIFIRSTKVFFNFELDDQMSDSSYVALLSLKKLMETETVPARKFLIITYFFNGLRNNSGTILTGNHLSIIQTNFRNLIVSLNDKLEEDEYKSFMNAFIHIWHHPQFTYFLEAVTIMNNLNKRYHLTLLDILHKLVLSKECNNNLFKLSCAIMCNPPKYKSEEKVIVTNSLLLKNIMLNCLSDSSEIANSAIDSFAEILLSPDLEKKIIKEPIFVLINSSDSKTDLNLPTILRGFKSLIKQKWSGSKNKQLFPIILSFMSLSTTDYPDLYREIWDILTEEASPFDLKPYLQFIANTYIKLYEAKNICSSLLLLKTLMKCALHTMASSSDYVKYLYFAMVGQSATKSEYFIDPIISDEFNYEELFQKCQTLRLISLQHIEKLMGNLSLMNKSNLKLLSALIHLTDYRNLPLISEHISKNVANSENLNYLFFIYGKLLKNNPANFSYNDNCNRDMVFFLKKHLKNQSLGSSCIANAFSLLKRLESYINFEETFNEFKLEYELNLTESLQNKTEYTPLLYYSQLVIFARIIPEDSSIATLNEYLRSCEDEMFRNSEGFSTDFWTAALFLYTNICVIRTRWVETGLSYLLKVQNCSNTAVKLAAINMSFDLCNLVTHNFEDLIKYMFSQLIVGDYVYKKSCLKKIDGLIRDEYLKLDLCQFIIFVSMLEDSQFGLGDFFARLLSEHFLVQRTLVIAKYIVPFIVHSHLYKKHPLYQISDEDFNLIKIVSRKIVSRHRIYKLLFTNINTKIKFNIISILSTTILQKMITKEIDVDENFLKIISDSVYIFKLIAMKSNNETSTEHYYKKVLTNIPKKLLNKNQDINADKTAFLEYHKEIDVGTETLLKLLYSCSNSELKITIFNVVIHWTDYFMDELVYMVRVDKRKKFEDYYQKLEKFYMQNSSNIRNNVREDENIRCSRERDGVFPSTSGTFSFTSQFVPTFSE